MKRYRVTIELIDETAPSGADMVHVKDHANLRMILDCGFIGGDHNRMLAFETESDKNTDMSIHIGFHSRPL